MNYYEQAVFGVGFDLIDSQFERFDDADDLHDLLEPYFGEHVVEAEALAWEECFLRATVLYGERAKKILKEDYGVDDASVFPDED